MNPFNRNTIPFPDTISSLYETIEHIVKTKGHCVLSVCGGSCTGKSTVIADYLKQKYGAKCVIVSQDRFMGTGGHLNQINEQYRWDDPSFYSINSCVETIAKLRKDINVEVPVFSFTQKKQIATELIEPRKLIIFEGLYTAFGRLKNSGDINLYVEAPLYSRIILRLFRNTLERYKGRDYNEVLNGVTGSVLHAHKDFVVQQKEYAHYCIGMRLDMPYLMDKFNLSSVRIEGVFSLKYSLYEEGSVNLNVYEDEALRSYFSFEYEGECFLFFELHPDLEQRLMNLDFSSR